MAHIEAPGEYHKLAIRSYPARHAKDTPEGKYWKQFKAPETAKQIGSVTNIDFCPTSPHDFAVTASMRVMVYDGSSHAIKRTVGRFKDIAYSGSFRPDGKLLCAGGANGLVQVFDAGSRAVLRQFKGHKAASRTVRFSADNVHVLSGGDDATVRQWDITTGDAVNRLDGHEDYVRSVAPCPTSNDLWLSGGYDHSVRLWDVRSGDQVAALDHGAAVEAVAWLPSGTAFVSVGGTHVCVWDALRAGQQGQMPLHKMANHQKTVSCVSVPEAAGPGQRAPRLITGSLDGHVKIYELDTFKVTHVSRYPAPVLSVGLSPNSSLLAVGMADGLLSIRRNAKTSAKLAAARKATRQPSVFEIQQPVERKLTAGNYRYFLRGQKSKPTPLDTVLPGTRQVKLTKYEKALKAFRYSEALDAALATRHADVVSTLLQELATRGGLLNAIAGRDPVALTVLVHHVARHLGDTRFADVLARVADMVVDMYAATLGSNEEVDRAFRRLQQQVKAEVLLQQQLAMLGGTMEPLIVAGLKGNEQ